MYRLALFLFLIAPAWPQFVEIATTDDGQQVYFTSLFTLKIAPPSPRTEARLYRTGSGAIELFVERGDLARPDGGSSNDGVSSIQVSGDGQSVAFTMTNICPPGDPCRTTIQRAEVRGRYAQILGDGTVWMSRNGRWAILNPPPFVGPGTPGVPPAPSTEATLINLETSQRTTIPIPAITRGNPLASDGTVFVRRQSASGQGFESGFWKAGEFKPLTGVAGPFSVLAISDDGRTLFYSRIDPPPPGQPMPVPKPQLIARDLTSNTDLVLHAAAEGERQDWFGASNDGRRVLFRVALRQTNGRALVADTRIGRIIELLLPPGELAANGALSGDGNVAFVFSNAGRLLRFDLDQQGNPAPARELLPPTPYLCCQTIQLSPGEVVRFEAVLPGSEWRNHILLNDAPLPVLTSDSTSVTVLVPWEIRTGQAIVRIEGPAESPFLASQTGLIIPARPRFVAADPGTNPVLSGLKIIRGDFSGVQTMQPGPGEIVHLYMTGLGRVRGPVENGVPAPLDDVRPITGSIGCRFLPHPFDAETLFVGLAPGFLGYYQATFRMPAEAGTAPLNGVNCRFATEAFTSNMVYTQAILSPPMP